MENQLWIPARKGRRPGSPGPGPGPGPGAGPGPCKVYVCTYMYVYVYVFVYVYMYIYTYIAEHFDIFEKCRLFKMTKLKSCNMSGNSFRISKNPDVGKNPKSEKSTHF